ncbi:MAG: tetratricopeptide repeat protein [Hyphomicrobiaceae bacterium]
MVQGSRLAAPTLLLIGALAWAPEPLRADPVHDCRAASNPETRIAACTAVIALRDATSEQKAVAYRNRGRARAEAGALDAALSDLGEAIGLKADDGSAYAYRAQVHVARKNVDAAIADYGQVIRLKPKWVLGHNGRGHTYLLKGDAQQAIDDFSQALRLAPGSAVSHNNRGLAYKAAGNLPRAIEDFTTAITINPIYALAYNNRGYAHEASGHKKEAIDDFRNALLLDPSLTGAREGLQRLGAMGNLAAESARLIGEGKTLVESHCARCHATGLDGASPNASAPTFRSLHERHPMQALREPLTRGIAAPHDEMPKFRLPDIEVDKIVAYINSLESRK